MTTIARILATGFGLGYFPYTGRATVASLPFLLLVPLFLPLPLIYQLGISLALFIVGVVVAGITEKHFGVKDDGRIVIDEIASIFFMFVGLGVLPWWLIVFGFLLNRAIDIWKPWLIRTAEKAGGGMGIMLDDLLVALCVNVCLHGIIFLM